MCNENAMSKIRNNYNILYCGGERGVYIITGEAFVDMQHYICVCMSIIFESFARCKGSFDDGHAFFSSRLSTARSGFGFLCQILSTYAYSVFFSSARYYYKFAAQYYNFVIKKKYIYTLKHIIYNMMLKFFSSVHIVYTYACTVYSIRIYLQLIISYIVYNVAPITIYMLAVILYRPILFFHYYNIHDGKK